MSSSTIIFLPGFMCDARLFAPQTRALTHHGFHCKHMDTVRGFSLEAIAGQILKTAPKRFALVGLSMGGLIAFELYRLAPERITHMALLNTTARADAAGEARKSQLQRVARGELDLVLREDLKPQYLHPDNRTPDRLQVLETMGRDLGEDVFCSQTMALAKRKSYLPLLPNISCPTLVIAGADDAVCSIDRHQEIADAVPDCDFRILQTGGHISTLEQPEQVNAALRELLSKPPAQLTKTGNVNLKLI